jgi:hypothetical protein
MIIIKLHLKPTSVFVPRAGIAITLAFHTNTLNFLLLPLNPLATFRTLESDAKSILTSSTRPGSKMSLWAA